MNTNSNTYDIDGKLLRKSGDNSKLTVDEAKERIDYYYDKLKEFQGIENLTPEQFLKRRTYAIYIQNLTNYLNVEMSKLSKEDLSAFFEKYMPKAPEKTTSEQVEEAMEELKKDLDEPKSVTQEDLLVERDAEAPVMDEYVSPIGEDSDEYVDFKEVEEPKTEDSHD